MCVCVCVCVFGVGWSGEEGGWGGGGYSEPEVKRNAFTSQVSFAANIVMPTLPHSFSLPKSDSLKLELT